MGGEKAFAASMTEPITGSPPHGRGKDLADLRVDDREGITPAWAGKR